MLKYFIRSLYINVQNTLATKIYTKTALVLLKLEEQEAFVYFREEIIFNNSGYANKTKTMFKV